MKEVVLDRVPLLLCCGSFVSGCQLHYSGRWHMPFMLGAYVLKTQWLCCLLLCRVHHFLLQSYTLSIVLASAITSVKLILYRHGFIMRWGPYHISEYKHTIIISREVTNVQVDARHVHHT